MKIIIKKYKNMTVLLSSAVRPTSMVEELFTDHFMSWTQIAHIGIDESIFLNT